MNTADRGGRATNGTGGRARMDLMDLLREIERRAALGREAVDTGRRIGVPTNGRTALYAIERLARDAMQVAQTTAGAPKGARTTTTPSSHPKGA
jgi:hypothetical protein